MILFLFLLWISYRSIHSDPLIKDKKVTCSSSTIDIELTFNQKFHGGVLVEKHKNFNVCSWKGNGSKQLAFKVPMSNSTICSAELNKESGFYNIKLLISPVDGIIVDGFNAINVQCIYAAQNITLPLPEDLNKNSALQIKAVTDDNSVITGSGISPSLSMHILNGHGINGTRILKAAVGQRITLDLVLQNTEIYDFYVHSCYAHDGNNSSDASIVIIDSHGCAVRLSRAIDVPVFSAQPITNGPKHVYLQMYGFQFTSTNFVHFECQVKPCIKSCHREQCIREEGLIESTIRKRKSDSIDVAILHLQAVLEITPQTSL